MSGFLSTQLHDAPKHSGVYTITNSVNGKVYVGSAADIQKRWKQHVYHLGRGDHGNKKLWHSWSKHGSDVFHFNVILQCSKENLTAYEQAAIDAYGVVGWGYNISPTAGSNLGSKRSPETRAKISAALMGKVATAETRAKMVAYRTGRPISTAGRNYTAELREKLAQAKRGKKQTAEHVAKRTASLKTPEGRARMSVAKKGTAQSQETIAKRTATMNSPETRAKLSAIRKGKKQSPETIAKRMATQAANRGSNTKANPIKKAPAK